MASDKTGRVVWHDLFTDDATVSRSFYGRVAGWHYVIEHAEDFAWGGGERDFILALLDDEAGAGIIEHNNTGASGWVPYVEVENVDATARIAENLNGTVVKVPFEVPGVGRNCLLRDPNGVLFGISLSRHMFPAPTMQFGPEVYSVGAGVFPEAFYKNLFGWSAASSDQGFLAAQSINRAEKPVGFCIRAEGNPSWIPSMNIAGDLRDVLCPVEEMGGSIVRQIEDPPDTQQYALCVDPIGSQFCLTTG